MNENEEQECRVQAFYLLKKYTSYTFLAHAVNHYRIFLTAFDQQLRDLTKVKPEPDVQRWFEASVADGTYEGYYQELVEGLAVIEKGLELLKTTPHKFEAYRSLRSSKWISGFTGRGADFRSVEHDPFFLALGMRSHSYNDKNEFVAAPIEGAMLNFYEGLHCFHTLNEILIEYSSTSYEYLLNREDNRFSITYPPPLSACPVHNSNPDGQIWSDRVIPISGIWEPWFANEGLLRGVMDRLTDKNTAKLTGKVGCPNYFLAGTVAYNYRMENARRNKERVVWRLLWEDVRYLDGTVPEEEREYV